MADNKSSKGNPASHRMSNAALKERRKKSHLSGEKRKAARREAQKLAEKRNILLLDSEKLTPWQEAKAKRAERRNADPFILRRRRIFMADALKMPTDAGHRA